MAKMKYLLLLGVTLNFCVALACEHESCVVKDQSGSSEFSWCREHNQKDYIRCYAEVKFNDGKVKKVWGKTCYPSYSDCWSTGKGKVEPDCLDITD